jgi:acyl-CoA hydrolase
MTASGLAGLVRAGDTIVVSTGAGEPKSLINELCQLAGHVEGITVIQVMTGGGEQLAEASGNGLRLTTPMPGRKARLAIREDRADLIVASMSQIAHWMASGRLRVDGVLVGAGLAGGRPTFGLAVDYMPIAFTRARFRAVEVNAHVTEVISPFLDVEKADYVVRSDESPSPFTPIPVSETAARIGDHVADIVEDGATVEIGIGRALAGVAPALGRLRRDLAVHGGLLGDDAMHLVESGAASRALDRLDGAVAAGTVALGSASFHAWLAGNSKACLVDSSLAHDVGHLCRLPNFTAINSGLAVDLLGQVNTIGEARRIVAGVAGALDFAAAGALGAGSIVAIEARRPNGAPSIVPQVAIASIPAAMITHLVTEFGVATLRGLSPTERCQAIADIAHPEDRARLLAAR